MESRVITIRQGRTKKNYHTSTSHETEMFATRLAKTLRGGDVLALSGELGAGKTVFTNGIAKGLGIKKQITSPTFVLMMLYPIPKTKASHKDAIKLCHIDTYRLGSAQGLIDIGIQDYIGKSDVITVIEWPEKIAALLPSHTINIHIEHKA